MLFGQRPNNRSIEPSRLRWPQDLAHSEDVSERFFLQLAHRDVRLIYGSGDLWPCVMLLGNRFGQRRAGQCERHAAGRAHGPAVEPDFAVPDGDLRPETPHGCGVRHIRASERGTTAIT